MNYVANIAAPVQIRALMTPKVNMYFKMALENTIVIFQFCIMSESKYSRTSMARTPLGPWKVVRDRCSSIQWGLIIAQRPGGTIRISLIFYNMKVCCVFSLESPQWGDSNEYTQYTAFNIKRKLLNFPILQPRGYFLGAQAGIRNSRGKRAISVRATEVLL